MDVDSASEKRKKQNRNAQRTHRNKKKLIEAAKEQELESTKADRDRVEAERDQLRQKLSMYETSDFERAPPAATTPPWLRLSHKQATPLNWGKDTVGQADYFGLENPGQTLEPFETLEHEQPIWPEQIGSKFEMAAIEDIFDRNEQSQYQQPIPKPSTDPLVPQAGTALQLAAPQVPMQNYGMTDLLPFVLSEWEKSENYHIKSAEQYDKAAERKAQNAQFLLQLYTSYATSTSEGSNSINASWIYHTGASQLTNFSCTPQQVDPGPTNPLSQKLLLGSYDENTNILDPSLSIDP